MEFNTEQKDSRALFSLADEKGWQVATLAGGCFWGLEHLFGKIDGVVATQTGYTGGNVSFPEYSAVKTGSTNHAESVQVLFNPKVVSLEEILYKFFSFHNPTTPNRQGNDVGTQYRSAIFYANEEQKKIAEVVRDEVERSGLWESKVVTEIVPLQLFWRAEEYHQLYLQRNPAGYTCNFDRGFSFRR